MSTFTLKKEMQCAHCGQLTIIDTQPETVFGGSDLDTRPSEHPALATVHRCPQCGYCAYDLSASLPGIAGILASAAYQAHLTSDAGPESIQNHLCAALLYEQTGNVLEAGWVYVNLAWFSDDAGDTKHAQTYRLQAVDCFEQAIATGVQPSETPGAKELFLSDLLRRAEAFDRALAYCEVGLAAVSNHTFRALLRYEKTLIAVQDRGCHTTAEGRSLVASMEEQQHLLLVEDNKGQREFVLDAPFYTIGRDPKCDISLVSQFVSRWHATLVQLRDENGSIYYRIVDGNLKGKTSANGLILNGREKIQAHDLVQHDEIVFGPQVRATYYFQTPVPPNDDFGSLTAGSPHEPSPLSPNVGAEALPDDGFSQLP